MTDTARDADVIQLRPEPESVPPLAGDEPGKRRPIVPEQWQRGNIRASVRQLAGQQGYRAAFHGIRLPIYVIMTVVFALAGVRRLIGQLLTWWHAPQLWELESRAVAAGRAGHSDAMSAHTQGLRTRAARGKILAVCAVLAVLVAVLLALVAPHWLWVAAAPVVAFLLARHGKPDGKSLVSAAIVPPKYEPPTPIIITKALGSLGIAAISDAVKTGSGITFVTDVHRDGEGWGCDLDLPHGVTAEDILKRRPQFASGLRRPLSATWPEPVPDVHEGRVRVWIGFTDISKVKPKPYPLLKAGTTDVFSSVPFGTDPRGRPGAVPLFEVNWLVGAAPGQGKTNAVRLLAAGAALDPLADLWVHEHAGKGDLDLSRICHRYVSGLDDEAIGYAAASLRMLRAELERRSGQFKKLDRDQKPEGKLTRELAARRGGRLRPIVAFFDEAQNLFMHPEFGEQAADDAAYVIRLGRAYGIIIVLSTQRPDKESLPTAIRGIVTARFCMQVADQDSNDMILGTGAYRAGYNSVNFRPKTDAGMGWLKAETGTHVIRTYKLDLKPLAQVVERARVMREQGGYLTGYALGEQDAEEARDFLGDVLSVFGPDSNLYTETVAARLAERVAGGYADITKEAVASQLRALEVTVKQVRERGGPVKTGVARADVEAAAGVTSEPV